ncbi:hypothetical protein BRC75_09190 [Halobacteriales archaeon QH_7_69_31]|nr:MAG: hypothetical protein BRC75_09190 [Halobacteriales archaeon QH_7_69_31]
MYQDTYTLPPIGSTRFSVRRRFGFRLLVFVLVVDLTVLTGATHVVAMVVYRQVRGREDTD